MYLSNKCPMITIFHPNAFNVDGKVPEKNDPPASSSQPFFMHYERLFLSMRVSMIKSLLFDRGNVIIYKVLYGCSIRGNAWKRRALYAINL